MKVLRIIFQVLLITLLLSSCRRDKNNPIVTLKGNQTDTAILNKAYIDPGAIAMDEEDGDISALIMVSGAVNKDSVGLYLLSYLVRDEAGNPGIATRKVLVRNEAESWAGEYRVTEVCDTTYKYEQTITASKSVNRKIHFDFFGDYANNTGIYANVTDTSINLPFQTARDIGFGPNSCDVATHEFSGNGYKTSTGFSLTYTDKKTKPGCEADTICTATFTRK